jgi:hypothetical protein
VARERRSKDAVRKFDIVKMMATVSAWLEWETEFARRAAVLGVRKELRRREVKGAWDDGHAASRVVSAGPLRKNEKRRETNEQTSRQAASRAR